MCLSSKEGNLYKDGVKRYWKKKKVKIYYDYDFKGDKYKLQN
jgi:hypothetical protein